MAPKPSRRTVLGAIAAMLALALIVLVLVVRLPVVVGLGSRVKLPIFHGASTWVDIMLFVLMGIAALVFVVRRDGVTIAISTGGGSPALAKRLRQRLEATIGPEYEAFLAALRELRTRAQQVIADPAERQALFRRAVESDLFAHAARGDKDAVAACISELLQRTP